jgi:DNA-3-methyladenine glycosylase II
MYHFPFTRASPIPWTWPADAEPTYEPAEANRTAIRKGHRELRTGARPAGRTHWRDSAEHSVKPAYWDEATRTLGKRDRVLRKLIRAHPDIHLRRRSDPFTTLARAIVGQQISVKAADSVWRRLVAAVADDERPAAFPKLDSGVVADTGIAPLRHCGLSERKAEYLRDLASRFASGALDPKGWRKLDDEALIGALVEVKGIGRWTAEMFLIFHELRADVLPVADIGLQRAVALHYHGGTRVTPAAIRKLALEWQPYRSVATWYLWRSLDPLPVEY